MSDGALGVVRVFARLNGEVAAFDVATEDWEEARAVVRESLPSDWVGALLIRVK